MQKTYLLTLAGLTCSDCSDTITRALQNDKRLTIQALYIDPITNTGTITVTSNTDTADNTPNLIRETIEETGFECPTITEKDSTTQTKALNPLFTSPINHEPNIAKSNTEPTASTKPSKSELSIRQHLWRGLFGLGFAAVLIGLSISGIGIPFAVMLGIMGIASLGTAYLGWPSYKNAYAQLRRNRKVKMDMLFSISTLVAVTVSWFSLLFPGLPMLVDAGLLIFGFRHIGNAISKSSKKKITEKKSFRENNPESVVRYDPKTKTRTKVLLALIQPGDQIILQAGDYIPVDGRILSDNADIDERNITGVTKAKHFTKGDEVLNGMRLADRNAEIFLHVEKSENESNHARSDQQLETILLQKSKLQSKVTGALQYFVPGVILIALIAASILYFLVNPFAAIQIAVGIGVSACPCGLGFIVPLALRISKQKAAEHGVLFKEAESMEAAADIQIVFFDFYGTLTQGNLAVSDFTITEPGVSPADFFEALQTLEENLEEKDQEHAIAQAIMTKAQPYLSLTRTKKKMMVRKLHGGLIAEDKENNLCVGNEGFMEKQGIITDPPPPGEHRLYLARNNRIIGFIKLAEDALRDDAIFTIQELKRSGKIVKILTGSLLNAVQPYSAKLGIPLEDIHANLNPQEKAELIKSYQTGVPGKTPAQRVAMVGGDSSNDTLAIAQSDCGITMDLRSSQDVTKDNADVIIAPRLLPVLTTFTIAKHTKQNLQFSLPASFVYNMSAMLIPCIILLAIGFAINPAIGAALMVIQTTLLLALQYYYKKRTLEHIKRYEAELSQQQQNCDSTSSYQLLKDKGLLSTPKPAANTTSYPTSFSKCFPCLNTTASPQNQNAPLPQSTF